MNWNIPEPVKFDRMSDSEPSMCLRAKRAALELVHKGCQTMIIVGVGTVTMMLVTRLFAVDIKFDVIIN